MKLSFAPNRPTVRFFEKLAGLTLTAAILMLNPSAVHANMPIPAVESVRLPNADASFMARLNELRTQKGLQALKVDVRLEAMALDWSKQMVLEDRLYHNPNLTKITTAKVNIWRSVGENVGWASQFGEVVDVHDAFVESYDHYVNMINPRYDHVGIVTMSRTQGGFYVTVNFIDLDGKPGEYVPAPIIKRKPVKLPPKRQPPKVTQATKTLSLVNFS